MSQPKSDTVLLTGISGFLGGHVALQLLNAGYILRGSVRNLLTGQLYISLDFVANAKPVAYNPAARPLEIPTIPGSMDKLQAAQAVLSFISKHS